jgi:tetratricopeptide (TPR) repeat protein
MGTGLTLALVAVFWVLPQLVEKPKIPVPQATQNSPQPAPGNIKESPYSDAEIAQQRRNVQKILQDILLLQEELEERQIKIWADEEFSAAQSLAEGADTIYRQRKFMQAQQQYQQSLAALQQLRDSIPERIEQHIAQGQDALDIGDAKAAHQAFDLVLTISDNHPRGLKGKARAEKLPQAWASYNEGKQAFTKNSLDKARDALQAALAIDAETRPASELLPRVLAAITERDYSEAMSSGYSALGRDDFSTAKKAFERAQALKPQATDPAAGLAQAQNGLGQNRLEQLVVRAGQQEAAEQWHAAAESYGKLLEADSSLVSAITGKARSGARAKLDDQLQELLGDPLSLGNSQRNQFARQVLADARKLNAQTPRISDQIERLENALTKALIPIVVRLQSDSSTRVTIYHVGQLGNFAEREITLKPGRYTAVGTREGYRDVRHEFVVDPASGTSTVVIQCAERINSANNG